MDFTNEVRKLKDAGMQFTHCIQVFGENESNAYVHAARSHMQQEGRLEVDSVAVVSESKDGPNDGAYVMSWVWVSNAMASSVNKSPLPAPGGEILFALTDQPFTCVDCGSRTHQVAHPSNMPDRWIESCPQCSKQHQVEAEEAGDKDSSLFWFHNFYCCPKCGHEWEDHWDCGVDDECPVCSVKDISPHRSDDTREAA